jgi:hypothetical protein
MSDIDTAAPVVAIPAPEAPAAQPAPEIESTADQSPVPEGESTPEVVPEKTFTQAELDKIIQKRLHTESRKAEREAQAREERIREEVESRLSRLQPQTPQPTGEPEPQNFKDYESYIAAKVKFDVDREMSGIKRQSEAQREAEFKRQQAATVLPKLKSAVEKYDDFKEVVTSFKYAPEPMQAAMLESDITGELYYHIGNNPDELERISALSPTRQVEAILKLEAKLKAPPSPTKTPAPIIPNSANSTARKSMSDMNQDEFDEYRRNRLARKRR